MREPGQQFDIVSAPVVEAILAGHRAEILEIVRAAYLAHGRGLVTNPSSQFLRFPDKSSARIIALPARLKGDRDIAGIKWIASFPENRERNLPRASAVMILNDMETGFPIACLEATGISAARTAASATVAMEQMHAGRQLGLVAVIGAGPIASTTLDYIFSTGRSADDIRVHDLVLDRAAALVSRLQDGGCSARVAALPEEAISGADLVLLATTATIPHLSNPSLFTPKQTVLHLSLRDLSVPIVLAAQNIVDDVGHALSAQTSLHLAATACGHTGFVAGTIADMLSGNLAADPDRVRIFSPFGLGALDVAVASFVLGKALAERRTVMLGDFFTSP